MKIYDASESRWEREVFNATIVRNIYFKLFNLKISMQQSLEIIISIILILKCYATIVRNIYFKLLN